MNIFINYRRADSAYQTDRLCELLSKYLQKPKKQLYMDIESTALGVDYIEVISEKISECDVMLTLIGEEWLTLQRPNTDVTRIHEDSDLVRKEIRTALEAEKPVVPTMFDGATYLKESDLPADIANLAWRNGISIQRDTFEEDVHRLAEGLGLTKDNRKYGVFIASQAPLLGYIAYDQSKERKEKNEQQELSRPPEFTVVAAAAAAASSTAAGTSQAARPPKKVRPIGGAVVGAIALAVIAKIFCPPPPPPPPVYEWTLWRSTDMPGGDGDFETISHWKSAGTPACDNPQQVECRTVDTEIAFTETGQIYKCNTTEGGYCRNEWQSGGQQCLNYEVRYFCPKP